MARYRETGAPIVRPTSGARHGHPLLVDRSLFAALRAGDPAIGPKPIVRAHATAIGDLPVEDEGAFLDVDTAEQYAKLINDRSIDDGGGRSQSSGPA
jgi:molybdenum cofactor cytidylyltransferase